jgi:hypothetical protein
MTSSYRSENLVRPYRFSAVEPDAEGEKGIREAYAGEVASLYFSMQDNDEESLMKVMHDFTSSPEFLVRYSDDERDRALGAFAACAAGRAWSIGSSIDTSGLFPAVVPEAILRSNIFDGLVLSGALGWHLDDGELIEFGREHGMLPRQAFLLAGAAGSAYEEGSQWLRGSYTRASGALLTQQAVGADLHGDFRAVRTVSARDGIVAPNGESVPFAPVISNETMRGYHSTEPAVVRALLSQLRYAYPEEANEQLQRLEQHFPKSDKENRLLFADFGGKLSPHGNQVLARERKPGDVLERISVGPGEESGTTLLVHDKDGVHVHHVSIKHPEPRYVMSIPNDEIVDFILAIGQASQGRTSVHQIRSVIVQALR